MTRLTRQEIMDALETIKICTAYDTNGARSKDFPTQIRDLATVKPVYEELPGWKQDISACRSWDDLPENARRYFDRIEEFLGVPIALVGVGPGREQTIMRRDPFS